MDSVLEMWEEKTLEDRLQILERKITRWTKREKS